MSIATRVKRFLDQNRVSYQILNHERAHSPLDVIHKLNSSQKLKISPKSLLKALPITDGLNILMAVLPWSYEIDFVSLDVALQGRFKILPLQERHSIFYDCEMGCVPPFGEAYGLGTILDMSLKTLDNIYGETGSQSALLHMGMDDFRFLHGGAPLFSFAYPSTIKNSDEIVMINTDVMINTEMKELRELRTAQDNYTQDNYTQGNVVFDKEIIQKTNPSKKDKKDPLYKLWARQLHYIID